MLRGAPGEKGGGCMQGANGTEQRRLCGMYMLYFAGYMAFFSFYALYLTQHGFSRQALGVISSGTAAANLAALILSGLLADHVLSPKKIVLAGSLSSALWGLLLLRASGSLGAALLAVVPVSFFDFALMGMLDAWTSLAARRNSRVQYSVARGLGGLAGAAASLVLGHLLPLAGTGRLVWFHLGFYLLLFLAACRARGTAPQGRVQPGRKPRGTRLWSGRYLLFLTAALLVFLGWRALLTYLPSMVVELGGDSRQQGFLMAEMSLCSMAAMGLYPRLRRRLGVRAFLLAGAAFMAVPSRRRRGAPPRSAPILPHRCLRAPFLPTPSPCPFWAPALCAPCFCFSAPWPSRALRFCCFCFSVRGRMPPRRRRLCSHYAE